ncbi:hypothetical protein Misp01_16510 [Microtetraspora sp. NBRC 13810]|nr:hypothetical protein Misp01_16510 [Microtetraspora sp. NBRC 13810]
MGVRPIDLTRGHSLATHAVRNHEASYGRKLRPQATAASYGRKLRPQATAASYGRKLRPYAAAS